MVTLTTSPPATTLNAMAEFAGGKIEIYLGPHDLGGPDDLEAAIVDFLSGAERSLDIAVQEIDSVPIAQAILDARWREPDPISVSVYLEQDYLREDRRPQVEPQEGETEEEAIHRAQWSGYGSYEENRRIADALLTSTIDTKSDYNPDIFHQKFCIRDYRDGAIETSALLTGSTNFTTTDTHQNLNHIVVFNDTRICAEYRTEFEQIRRGEFGRREHGRVPRAYSLGGVPVKVLFAPDHTPELEVVKQLLRARDRVDFAIFTFAGSSAIDDAMLILADAGITVRGVLDRGQAAQPWAAPREPGAAPRWLDHDNIELYVPKAEGDFEDLRKVHHKLMVIDDSVAIAGSYNYTAPANEYNDENLFVIGSPFTDLPSDQGGPVDPDRCAAITSHLRDEIERIIAGSERWHP
jgi:phosphatidylserine/phosphatidylglycerophosphate/cardiolipin synthase-like enzyme